MMPPKLISSALTKHCFRFQSGLIARAGCSPPTQAKSEGMRFASLYPTRLLHCICSWFSLALLLDNAQQTLGQDFVNNIVKTIYFSGAGVEKSACGKTFNVDRYTKYMLRPDSDSVFKECIIKFVTSDSQHLCVEQEEENTVVLDDNLALEFHTLRSDVTRFGLLQRFQKNQNSTENQPITDTEVCTFGYNIEFLAKKIYPDRETDVSKIHSTLAVSHLENPFRNGYSSHMCGTCCSQPSGHDESPDKYIEIQLGHSIYTMWYDNGRKIVSKSDNETAPEVTCEITFHKLSLGVGNRGLCVYYKPVITLDCTVGWRLTVADIYGARAEQLECSRAETEQTQTWCWPSIHDFLKLKWQLTIPTSGYATPEIQFQLIVSDFKGGNEVDYRKFIENKEYLRDDGPILTPPELDEDGEGQGSGSEDNDESSYDYTDYGSSDAEDILTYPLRLGFSFELLMLVIGGGVGLVLIFFLTAFIVYKFKVMRSSRRPREVTHNTYDRLRVKETSEQTGTYI